MEQAAANSVGDDDKSDFSPVLHRNAATERTKTIVTCCFVVLVIVAGIGATVNIINSPEYRNSLGSPENGDDVESKTYYDIIPPQFNINSSWAPTLSPTYGIGVQGNSGSVTDPTTAIYSEENKSSTTSKPSGALTTSPTVNKIASVSSTLLPSASPASRKETPNISSEITANNTMQNTTKSPTKFPTTKPTMRPTPEPLKSPTMKPSTKPIAMPTIYPSENPTINSLTEPIITPTKEPITKSRTVQPSTDPTKAPTIIPTNQPNIKQTIHPTMIPTIIQTTKRTMKPTIIPTSNPTRKPFTQPTFDPTTEPIEEWTIQPEINPTNDPTQSPTINPTINPTKLPTINPTSNPSKEPTVMPTIDPTTAPTRKPTINPTEVPTMKQTLIPTVAPTNSPLDPCHDVSIIIKTDFNTSISSLSVTTEWSLRDRESGSIVLSNGPLAGNQAYRHDICLQSSMYTFNITDYEGDGFGNCSECGFFIYVDDVFVGGSVSFYFNEEVTFPVPYQGNNEQNAKYDWCTNDFYLTIFTDQWPWETSWDLTDTDTGEIALHGGPYDTPSAIYSHRSCLRKGTFTFTIYDLENDGIESPGFYLLYAEDRSLAHTKEGSYHFGKFESTTFNFPSEESGEEI
ncbi:hypothetical protein ACHAXS_012422 [Conticribra weissflogii]